MNTQTFAVRFGTSEIATEFNTAFKKGQEEMKKLVEGLDSTEGAAEADEAAAALDSLAMEDKGKVEKSESKI